MKNSHYVEEALNIALRHYENAILTGTPEELKTAFTTWAGLLSAWKTLLEIEKEKTIKSHLVVDEM